MCVCVCAGLIAPPNRGEIAFQRSEQATTTTRECCDRSIQRIFLYDCHRLLPLLAHLVVIYNMYSLSLSMHVYACAVSWFISSPVVVLVVVVPTARWLVPMAYKDPRRMLASLLWLLSLLVVVVLFDAPHTHARTVPGCWPDWLRRGSFSGCQWRACYSTIQIGINVFFSPTVCP